MKTLGRQLLISLLLAGFLVGCGYKGDLVLPDEKDQKTQEEKKNEQN
ncbi:MAG: hypothetical protein HQL50_06890 [Magnetococcales bacterium]|nr:hypothetical protein [Magnetococcales bacterium]